MAARLYSTTYCPYAWSTRIVLNEKGVAFDAFDVDLKRKPTDFLEISPTARVPVFVDGETKIWESVVINEYIEEKYPLPNLFGYTPEERAIVRTTVLDHHWNRSQPLAKLAVLFYQRDRRDDGKVRRQLRVWYDYLDELDVHFSHDEWLAINRFTVADICLYATVALSQGFGMQIGERHCMQDWIERMNNRDSVQRSAPQTLPTLLQ